MLAVELLRSVRVWFTPRDPSYSILPFIPRPLKWLILFILLLNSRGLPLTWHVRVFRPAIYARIIHGFRTLIESPEKREARLTRMSPVSVDPFKHETLFRTRATPDACDFNMHLSNSSYAMTYDMVRFKYVVEHFPLFYRDGGWIALGATHYAFTREIPLNSQYEIRISLAGWDQKWMYMVARYITYPSKASQSKHKAKANKENKANSSGPATSGSGLSLPALVTPDVSAAPTPSRSPVPIEPIIQLGMPVPKGAVVHCTAISRLCCKIGRITIPPAILITTAGFAIPSERFAEIQRWRLDDDGARIKKFYAGGWRDVPEGERWWEDALGGEIERRRVEGLRALAGSVGIPVFGKDD